MASGDPRATRRVAAQTASTPASEPKLSAAFRARFQIHSTLGSGGMGVVYLATDKDLDRQVAIKFSNALDADSRVRFSREGQMLARLRHPNVIQVYDTGEEDGRPFLVFEVVEGASLSERIAREGALDLLTGLELGRQLAAGLASAHGEGVLHRDLKTSNALLTADGTVKLCDFGLAREASGADRVTAAGAFLGTPEYLAPEVIQGDAPSPASDLYALGCVLMEVMTGEPPYPAIGRDGTRRTIGEIVSAHLREKIPVPSERTFGLPLEVDALIMSCLAKLPSDRPRGASAVEQVLAQEWRKSSVRSHVRLKVARDMEARASKDLPAPEQLPSRGAAPRSASATRTAASSALRRSAQAGQPALPRSRRYLVAAGAAIVLLAAIVLVGGLLGRRQPIWPGRVDVPLGLAPIGTNQLGFGEYLNLKDGSELVGVPGGSFERGSEHGEEDERPVRQVKLSAFFIGKGPVTRAQYARFCSQTHHPPPAATPWRAGDEHPVVNVSWVDASAYCTWAGLRLPTEAEWEFAARGTDGRRYPWGNEPPDGGGAYRANYSPGDPARDGFAKTSPVGAFGPGAPRPRADGSSAFGLLDMAGNVSQWCQDWYDLRYYERGLVKDPVNRTRSPNRVIRGGAWWAEQNKFLYASHRSSWEPGAVSEYIGFRVAK